ncbi:hypothetical protein FISHEDRAFT_78274 [Fistulina hepatica ATCC 64428]|nr:hypothetical protein FISHEDRAFT_78274 [Fistulina hepatica ATCC 64428]
MVSRSCIVFCVLVFLSLPVNAHEHDDNLTDEEANKPVDAILWIHIFLQTAVWGVLFPIGMVLGMSRSRWHVPLQATGLVLTFGGILLGHAHKGRMFLSSAHGKFANILFIPIFLQLVLGVYLKLHIHEQTLRPYAVRAHGIVGRLYPVFGWTQMLLGAVAFRGYCRGGHLGQCLAHYIMGSAFIGYGCILAILFLAGEAWTRRSGRSPEWWDSWVITAWGAVNTFTEHHGGAWSHKDLQHTSLGIIWWAGGILGIYLSRNSQRNFVPAAIIFLTGWAMSEHAQALMISTKVHAMFGDTLMSAAVCRVLEIILFVPTTAEPNSSYPEAVEDDHATLADLSPRFATSPAETSKVAASRVFRHLTPFLLVASGVLFMSATDEELEFVAGLEIDHVTYVLLMYSLAFLIYTLIVFLINLYLTLGKVGAVASFANGGGAEMFNADGEIELSAPSSKWYARVPTADGAARSVPPQHVIGDEED